MSIEGKDKRKPDNRTIKQRQRAKRQEELREYLHKQSLVRHVIEDVEKLDKLNIVLTGKEVFDSECAKFKLKNDIRMKLINKYLPDIKQEEIVGEAGGPVVLTFDKQDEDA